MRRKVVGLGIIGIVALTAMIATGCGSKGTITSANSGKKLNIAVVHGLTADPYQINWLCGTKAMAKKLGVNVKIFGEPTIDAQAQSRDMSAALLMNPDGVQVDSWQASMFSAEAKRLMQKGIPVVSWNPLEPPTQYMTVSSDTRGELVTKQFVKAVGSGPGTVAVIGNVAGDKTEERRYLPLVEAIKKANKEIKVPSVQYDNSDISKATSIASAYILAHPDLKLILTIGGNEGMAAVAAVRQAKKVDTVKVWSYNTNPPLIKALREGIIVALGAEPSVVWGAKELEVLVEYLRSHPEGGPVQPSGKTILLPMVLVTKDNVDSPEVQPYIIGKSCDVDTALAQLNSTN